MFKKEWHKTLAVLILSFSLVGSVSYARINNISAGGIADIVEDLTPQFGGDVDGQGNDLNNIGVANVNTLNATTTEATTANTDTLNATTTNVSGTLDIPSGDPTINAEGELGVANASSSLNFHDGTAERVLRDRITMGATLATPTSTDPRLSLRTFIDPVTITAVSCSNATSTDTFDLDLRFGTDVNSAGTSIFSAAQTCGSTTASTTETFNDATIPGGNILWFEPPSAASSSAAHFDVIYRYDP